MPAATVKRNVFLLASAQALNMSGLSLMITVSTLVGAALAPDPAWATLPLGLQFTSAMLTTFPASMLMKQWGRRAGFSLGAVAAIGGGLIMLWAVLESSFAIFCAGNALIGVGAAFAQFYRFAAADVSDEAFRPKAISYVMAGGVVAAVAGPELAKHSRLWFADVEFAGCFVVLAALGLAALAIIQAVQIPRPSASERAASGRPLGLLVRQPVFWVAVLGGMIGYGTMSFIMTAAPLAMTQHHHHSFDDSAFVIQWHVLGMFLPSFFTGHLIARFGAANVMLAGALALAGCVAAAFTGTEVLAFLAGMVLLGVGWNFLYIGSSALLTEAYRPEERAKAQAFNDLMIGVAQAGSSFSAGWLLSHVGWQAVNLGVVAPILIAFIATIWLIFYRRARPAKAVFKT